MKTGDSVRDGRGRTFQVGSMLGRGLWGRSFAATEVGSGVSVVLKVAHGADDFPERDPALAATCSDILLEQGRLLEAGGVACLPPLEGRAVAPDGRPVLVLPRYPATLETRIAAGCAFEELATVTLAALERAQGLAAALDFHGNLRASNLLVDERGQVFLADPVTPLARQAFPALLRATAGIQSAFPPEVRDAAGSVPFGPQTDTYALGILLYRGIATAPGGDRFPDLPLEGLDRARLVALKDRLINRLKKEHSNPRFHTRLSDRAASLMNRALSRETSPSPPYRFRRLDELHERLTELVALVHPTVAQVGRAILDRRGASDGFLTDEDIGFSCTVTCSPGVESHEEVACGIAFFDADTGDRLRNVPCAYAVDRQPTGRFRFGFTVTELPPGRYRARVAFTIRDSGDEPVVSEVELRVRPAPGYVPPRVEAPAPALPMVTREEDPPTLPSGRPATIVDATASDAEEAPTQVVDSAPRPTPIAPVAPPEPAPRPLLRTPPPKPAAPPPAEPAPTRPPPEPPAAAPARAAAEPRSAPPAASSPPLPELPRNLPPVARVESTDEPPSARSAPPLARTAPPLSVPDPGEAPAARVRPEAPALNAPRPEPTLAPPRPVAETPRPLSTTPRPTAAAPRPGPSAAARPAPRAAEPDPLPRSAGTWADLPLPPSPGIDLPPSRPLEPLKPAPGPTVTPARPPAGPPEPPGPLEELLKRITTLVRDDAYLLYAGVLVAVVLVLIILLVALK